MPRSIKCRDVLLLIPRKCFRLRAIILWFCLGILSFLSLLSMTLHGLAENRPANRNSNSHLYVGHGRSWKHQAVNFTHNHFEFNLEHSSNRRKLSRNSPTVGVDVGGDGGGGGGGGGVIIKSLQTFLEAHQNASVHKILISTNSIPALTDSQKDFLKDLNNTHDSNSHLGCEEIANLSLTRRVGRGTTKDVYSGEYKGKQVAVKMVSPKVQDIRACLRRKMYRKREECYVYANYKLMKEIAMAQQLQHPNIAQLIGYCIQSDPLFSSDRDHGVISVVEFGAKASLHRLSRLSWQERLQEAIWLADLLHYLEHSPLGSIAIWDYKHSQFIMTPDNMIKYSDLDDLSAEEPECETEKDCIIPKSNRSRVKCVDSRCHGHNAKFNLLRTTKEFFGPLLKEFPVECQETLTDMFENLRHLKIDAGEVKRILTEVQKIEIHEESL